MLRRDRELTRTVRRRLDALVAPPATSSVAAVVDPVAPLHVRRHPSTREPWATPVPDGPRPAPVWPARPGAAESGWVPGARSEPPARPEVARDVDDAPTGSEPSLDAAPADPSPTTDASDAPPRSAAALRVAARSYEAAHGTPLPSEQARVEQRRRRVRWSVSWPLVGIAGVALLVLAGGIALRAASATPGPAVTLPVPAPGGPSSSPSGEPSATTAPLVVVDVVGAVTTPGVVRLPSGSRVVDAVAAAGGAAADADVSGINLARVLVDGEQVVVPRPGEAPPPAAGATAAGGPVDLNTADAAALDALPGIGPVLAERIVAHRADGPFTSVDELGDVSGIGPTLLDRLRDLVRV